MDVNNSQLSRIEIGGYRSIKNCSLELRDVNVLIGGNGAGKSNFISVFSLIQSVLNKDLQLAFNKSGINANFYNGRKYTEAIRIEVFFGLNSYGFVLEPTDDNRVMFRNEFFGYHGNFNNESTLSRGHFESVWETGTNNRIGEYVIPILGKQNWKVYHFHDTSSSAKVKQEQNISNNKVLLYDAANLAAFLYRLKNHYYNNYRDIVETIKLVAPYFNDFMLEPQEGNNELIVLKWKQKGEEDIFNASQLSDGTLRFICLTTLLLQPDELQPETIIIDEPELGLHPYAVTMLAEMIKQTSRRKQVIVSTQSVELLNEFDVEDIVVVDKDNEGSTFRRLNTDELDLWLNDYSLGDLWKKNILGGRFSR